MDPELKALIDQLGRTFEEFKAAQDKQIAELKKGMADAVTEAKLQKINEDLDKLQSAKDELEQKQTARLDELEKKLNRPRGGGNDEKLEAEVKAFNASLKSFAGMYSRPAPAEVSAEAYAEYRKGFNAFVRGGDRAFSDAERKAMSVGSDPDGGYLAPADLSGRIVTRVFETSPMRQVASVQTIGTDALEGPQDTDEAASGGWVGETQARTTTATPQVGMWRIPVYEMYAQPEATQKLLDDASIDVEAWLGNKVADKLTRVENAAFITGDGVNKPRGLFTYTTAATADDSRAWGTFEHIVTGANGDFAASNPADKLFDLIGAMKDAYLTNARWMTRREVITKIRKFKESTTGNYLWQPGLQQGQPQTILGFPVSIAQDIPALASGSLSMAFGDFREAYQIVDRQGFRVLRDPYTNKPFVRFYTTRRVGGGALQFEAVKFLKFST